MKSSIMRVLLLAAVTALVNADHHAAQLCGTDCLDLIFAEVTNAKAMGFSDGDASTYAFVLHAGYQAAGAPGLAWVQQAVAWIGGEEACDCGTTCTKSKIEKCFKDATADAITAIDQDITDAAEWNDDMKTGVRMIFGAIANQIAPGSEPAKKWTEALTAEEFTAASKVTNIVGAWKYYVEPTLEAAFDDDADRAACLTKVMTTIGYVDGTNDLALVIAENGEEAFGADGLGSAECFGAGSPAKTDFSVTYAGATEATVFSADSAPLTALDTRLTTANEAVTAEVAKMEAEAAKNPDASATSGAAAVSAAFAAIALML